MSCAFLKGIAPIGGAALALVRWHGVVAPGGGIGIYWKVVLGWYWVVLGGIGTNWIHKGATCAFPTHTHMPTASKYSWLIKQTGA